MTLMNPVDPPESDQVRELTTSLHRLLQSGEHFRQVRAEQLHLGKSDLTALSHLYEDGPLTPRDLASRMEMTSGTMTPLLDRVEKAGFLTRNKNPKDRRSLLIATTPAGQHALEWLYEQFDVAVREALGGMRHQDPGRTVEILDGLSEALDANAEIEAPARGSGRGQASRPPAAAGTDEAPTGPHAV